MGRVTEPAPLRWADVGLVALGGALGTAAREGATLAVPSAGGIPYAIFVVNLLGALLLGVLFGALGRRRETERSRAARLLLGTGVLGGFTTYSALAGDTASLFTSAPALAAGYAIVTVVAGVSLAGLGLRLGGAGTSEAGE